MSVIINGMHKPKSCECIIGHKVYRCPLLDTNDDCKLQECKPTWSWEDQMKGCPIVESPDDNLVDATDTDADTISRKMAIDALGEKPLVWDSGDAFSYQYELGLQNQWESDKEAIMEVPSVKSETYDKHTETHACDCISRQDAIDALDEQIKQCDKALSEFETLGFSTKDEYAVQVERASLRAYREILECLPSVQPEIIRCKECKFYTPMNRETKTGICNLTMHQNFGDEWYCAGAERRTDE